MRSPGGSHAACNGPTATSAATTATAGSKSSTATASPPAAPPGTARRRACSTRRRRALKRRWICTGPPAGRRGRADVAPRPLRHLALCSGYGGFSLALHLALGRDGVVDVAHVERDSHAAA